MTLYSEKQIRTLHDEFKCLKKYADKLSFFDQWFGIIPFHYPDFDPHLSFLFQNEKIQDLFDTLKKERNNPGLTERKFSYATPLIFSIKPANSNSAAYSSYILSRFLSRSPVFDEFAAGLTSESAGRLLNEANGLINQLECCVNYEYDKTFRLQCMSVFYKGFYDTFTGRIHVPEKKRKFTELYLYAQGILYAQYISLLKKAWLKFRYPEFDGKELDLPDKLTLLNETGVLRFLMTGPHTVQSEYQPDALINLICLITGEPKTKRELILQFLMNLRNNASGRTHTNIDITNAHPAGE